MTADDVRQDWLRQTRGTEPPKERPEIPTVPTASDMELRLRHGFWWERRQIVRQALVAAGTTPNTLNSFDNCGGNAWAEEYDDEQGGWRVSCYKCKNRHCIPCGRAKALLVADNLKAKIDAEPYVHVVLTLKHWQRPFTNEAARLYDCFKQLREKRIWCGRLNHAHRRMPKRCRTTTRKAKWKAARHRLTFAWKDHTNGGCAFFQTKLCPDGCWHHHFHIPARSKWIPQQKLSQAWHRITGDSNAVYVGKVTNTESLVREVSRYAARPITDDLGDDVDKMAEAIRGMAGRHLFFTWGNWRGYKLTKQPDVKQRPIKRRILLTDLVKRAQTGEIFAGTVLDILRKRSLQSLAPPEDDHYYDD